MSEQKTVMTFRCPRCGSHLTKDDPESKYQCACGWEG